MIKPEIIICNRVGELENEIGFKSDDLILTEEFIYKKYLSSRVSNNNIIFVDRYGKGEPTDLIVLGILKEIEDYKINRIIAVGGGTVLDIAKIISLGNGGSLYDLFEKRITPKKTKELYLIPTTCGTGSEVTNISILELTSKKTKMGLVSDELFADKTILIPELLKGIPDKVFAASSIDALVHASESYVSPKANDYTKMFSKQAISIIISGYKQYIKNNKTLTDELCMDFLLASNYAGIAFGNAGCGAVHAMSYPLGASYHVPHGESNYVFYTEVFKKYHDISNSGALLEWERHVSSVLGSYSSEMFEKLDELLGKIMPKKKIYEYGVKSKELEEFTEIVVTTQNRLLDNNFSYLSREDIYELYRKLYE
jgi:4-hydroxybutyrate dehydrogenase